MIKKVFAFSVVCFFIIGLLYATAIVTKGITVYSDVDSTNIGIDEQVTLRLTIAGVGFFKHPDLPKMENFSVILTRQFTGMDFSKGKPVPYTVFEYMFMPHRKGLLEIPAIYVKYKGYYYSSEKYEIRVGDKLRKVRRKETTLPFYKFRGAFNSYPIFVQASISRKNIFYNQQIVYTYTIYTRVPIKKIPQIKIPEYEAFHREPLYYKKEYITEIGGTSYRAFEFKFSLFPYMTDMHVIPPVRMVLRKSNFADSSYEELGQYFEGRDYFITVSRAFKVNIKELPLKDKPLSFSGLIGKFDITSSVDKAEVGVNEYVILTVSVKGSGNIRSIPHIKCPLMDNLREYDSDVFMNFDKKEQKISGEKLFKFALMPREKGVETIPPVGFSYFDEEQGTYLTKWTEPIEIKIVKKKDIEAEQEGKQKQNQKVDSIFYIIGGIVLLFIGFILLFVRFK